jgi:hypothetical protein
VADVDNVPSFCVAEYALETMASVMDDTLGKYDEVKKDYDGKLC